MSLFIIRRNAILNNKKHSFLMLADIPQNGTFQVRNIGYNQLKAAMLGGKVDVYNAEIKNGDIEGKSGAITRYPLVIFRSEKDILSNNRYAKVLENPKALTIIGKYETEDVYLLANLDGKVAEISQNDLVRQSIESGMTLTNGSIVEGKFVRSISDGFKIIAGKSNIAKAMDKFKAEKEARLRQYEANRAAVEANREKINKVGETKQHFDIDEPTNTKESAKNIIAKHKDYFIDYTNLGSYSLKVKDSKSTIAKALGGEIAFDAKLMLASTTLKRIDPFLYGVYQSLNKIYIDDPNNVISTMAVSDDKLYINIANLKEYELPKISWILLHELSHIIMNHQARGVGKDHELWNIACDLYVNKAIDTNYGCKPGSGVVYMMYNNIAPIGLEFSTVVTDESIKESLFNDSIDITKDTPESIYNELQSENNKTKNNNKQQNDNEQGNNQKQAGDTSGDEQQQSEDTSEDDQQQSGDTSGDNQQSDSQDETETNQGNTGNNQKQQENTNITFRGKEVLERTGKARGDMIEDNDSEDHQIGGSKEAWSKAFISKIVEQAKVYMSEGSSRMLREAEQNLTVDPKWTSFVAKYMTLASRKERSFKRLHKRYIYFDVVAKGNNPNSFGSQNNVYMCVDVSGSMSDDELSSALGYIKATIRKYKAKGFMNFWSTIVDTPIEIKSNTESRKLKISGIKSTGGTDPNCLFSWFKSKQCKYKPNLIIVFTDGYFKGVDVSLKPNCPVVWVITDGDYTRFKPPFGDVAPIKPKI